MIATDKTVFDTLSREALLALAQSQQERLVTLQNSLTSVRVERDYYKEQLTAKLRALFAAKSEMLASLKQSDLFFNEAEVLEKRDVAEEIKQVAVAAHSKKKRGRKPLDPHLPREVVRVELPEDERRCEHDGAELIEIGVEASEQLDIIPAQLKVIRTERVKYACPCCDGTIKTAKAEARIIDKGLLSANALAWIITSKYQDALPLYRQAALLNRFGGDLNRNTLATSVVRCGEAVQPLINLLRDHLMTARLLHGDETELQVLKEPGKSAQSKSWLWLQLTDDGPPIRLFSYSSSRSGKSARELYEGYSGALMSDGYEPYAQVAAAASLIHLGCWVHARRKFIDAYEAIPKEHRRADRPAARIIALIAELYRLEQQVQSAREQQAITDEQFFTHRARLRQQESRPILEQIEQQLQTHLHTTAPQSLLGKALHYLAHQWPKLIRYIDAGHYPIDNNPAENAIRPFVIGRKNWLFADTVKGATASANLYSLIETAKANSLEPYHYLRHVLKELPKAQTVEDFEALLPWVLKADTLSMWGESG